MPMENESVQSLLERIRILELRTQQMQQQYQQLSANADEQQRRLKKLLDRITSLNLNSIIGAAFL